MEFCIPPEIPNRYIINSLLYKCKNCQNEYEHLLCKGNQLVKYIEKNGSEVRWLPTYGQGGYLDLLERLLENFKMNSEITMKNAKDFDIIFQNYTEKSANGNSFVISDGRHKCPNCESKELMLISEKILENPTINWMKISCDLLK
ncbi:MAG: hypothetical protein AB9836_11290 [Aminipila sp.]